MNPRHKVEAHQYQWIWNSKTIIEDNEAALKHPEYNIISFNELNLMLIKTLNLILMFPYMFFFFLILKAYGTPSLLIALTCGGRKQWLQLDTWELQIFIKTQALKDLNHKTIIQNKQKEKLPLEQKKH